MSKVSITQEHLKEILHYNPGTGVFTWNISLNNRSIIGEPAGFVKSPTGYICIGIQNKEYYAHRLAFLYMNGSFPKHQVDHINHDRTDNKWSNLREATIQENRKNHSLNPKSTTGIHGVNWYKAYKKWQVRIRSNNKVISIGYFSDFFEACCARKSAEIKHGFHENHGSHVSIG